MKIIFIRHGKTAGNLEKRYIGRTDEPLCEEGISELESIKYPDCDEVLTSPMKRCLQTAKLVYPDKNVTVCSDFPNGEAPSDFRKRCIAEFEKAVAEFDENTVLALVVHGGTIMSVLEKYAYPKGSYYDFQVPNAHGYVTEFDGEKIIITERI